MTRLLAAVLCLLGFACAQAGDTSGPAPSAAEVASQVTAGRDLFRDEQDPDVRRARNLFRREYLLASSRQSDENELRGIYERHVPQIGVNGILDVLEESPCHSQAHAVGKIIYARLGALGEAIHLAGDRCTNAVFHGILMEAFTAGSEHLNLLRLEDDIDRVCRPEVISTQKVGNCAHGIGHAVMSLSRYDVDRAVEACKRLERPQLQYYCATGAFMEYDGVHGGEDVKRSLHYPCDLQADFPAACYRYKMSRTVGEVVARGGGIDTVAAECLPLERQQRLGCFHGLGLAFLRDVLDSPALIKVVCGFGDGDDRRMCIEGAIEKLADLDESAARRACEHVAAEDRSICAAAAAEKMYRLDKDFSLYIAGPR